MGEGGSFTLLYGKLAVEPATPSDTISAVRGWVGVGGGGDDPTQHGHAGLHSRQCRNLKHDTFQMGRGAQGRVA